MTGPSFVPFEDMSDAEQREHLRDWHGCEDAYQSDHDDEGLAECHSVEYVDTPPHTHDKPAPQPEETHR